MQPPFKLLFYISHNFLQEFQKNQLLVILTPHKEEHTRAKRSKVRKLRTVLIASSCVLAGSVSILHGKTPEIKGNDTNPQLEQVFTALYHKPLWGGGGKTKSGSGSNLRHTKNLRTSLPQLLKQRKIRSLTDIPCGDFLWMSHVNLTGIERYTGIDIVPPLIKDNTQKYGSKRRIFLYADATNIVPPKSDLILCRDLFIHLTLSDICNVLRNFKRSGSQYLLASTYPTKNNIDLPGGNNLLGRPVDLQATPFCFPPPIKIIAEEDSWGKARKLIALWRIEDLPTI